MLSRKYKIYAVLTGIFCANLCIGVAIGSKVVTIFGLTASLSAFTFPLTFFITDTISEVYGKKASKTVVKAGLWCLIMMLILTQIAIYFPGSEFYKNQREFETVFGITYRYILAALAAYTISQYFDVWIFHLLKDKTAGQKLWLRNNVSTVLSQFVDTAIFVVIAFGGIIPLIPLFTGQFVIKVVIAILDTPFVYLLVADIKKKIKTVAEKEVILD